MTIQQQDPADVVEQRRRQIRRFAKVMDSRFRIPGTKQTFGVDPILGLVPGAGDAASMMISAGIVIQAARFGARGPTLAMMLFNVAIDAIFGSIPFFGTIFDVMFKANNRNVALLDRHVTDPNLTRAQVRRRVYWSIAIIVAFTVALFVTLAAITVWIIAWLI
ncbi:DUF4112 domain-containing protein [Hoyosella rhizosphaerae]|uniref:DUF4112 domain-containing protein n=1 Tax=Hoyosella rhizosphaerae TaxID=1755582 RepID=A0A916U2Y1_9ACTN|nr:DUF4112 domain-containing protein [Hoyosella rhizosphaerae]MBN4926973.1 DUF4112 domain-containing protein [Hoyosella rhizosphaerae]GGC55035.1 hypothetical protein GCM10011410_04290 [Hoyosella rhizosphaerae]